MAKIIISYRRSDSDVFAGRVRDRIAGRYGEDSVFIDVDNIPFGKDFRVHIQEALAESDAVLVIVGPRWLGASKGGSSRIMDAADPVRIEVETAIGKGIPTIPILVGKTNMPKPEQLPETLRNFAFINAAPVDTGRDFHRDLNRVMATINTILGLPLDTAERAAMYPDTTIEREPAAAIPAPTDEIVVRRGLVAGADNPVAVAAIAPTILQQSSRTDVNKTIDTFRIPKSAMAIVCGCIVILGAGWWFWANNVGMAPTTNVAPQIAAPVTQSTAPVLQSTTPVLQPTSPVPAAKNAENLDPGVDVVRAFYTALSHGDGAAAAALVIPERQKGGLSAPEMTQFYSGNFQPLQLISVLPYAQNSYQATYTFQRTAKSVICANSVIISVTQRNGRYLIQGIDARGGC